MSEYWVVKIYKETVLYMSTHYWYVAEFHNITFYREGHESLKGPRPSRVGGALVSNRFPGWMGPDRSGQVR